MEKQDQLFAVWLLQRGYANELTQAERFALAIRKNECTDEMLAVIGGNIDVFMSLGQPITASNLQPFLQDKFHSGPLIPKTLMLFSSLMSAVNLGYYKKRRAT